MVMRKGGSKAKGSAMEREICKKLSLWVSHGKREDLYWRSAMSGGRATVAGRRGINLASQAGDISSVDKAGHVLTGDFYFETKHVRNIGLDSFIVKNMGPMSAYWHTARKEARKYEKRPILIIKQNRFPTLFICELANVGLLVGNANNAQNYLARVMTDTRVRCEIWRFDDVLAKPFAYAEPYRIRA